MTFRPRVLVVNLECELRWLGHLFLPGLFDGDHRFAIEPVEGNRVRFTQEERFTGVLVPLFARSLEQHTLAGFQAMNQELKRRAESVGLGPAM